MSKRAPKIWTAEEVTAFKPIAMDRLAWVNNEVMNHILNYGRFEKQSLKEKLGDAFETRVEDPAKESEYYSAYNVPNVKVDYFGTETTIFEMIDSVRENLICQVETAKFLGKTPESHFLGGEIGLPNGGILTNARIISTNSGVITFAGRTAYPCVTKYTRASVITLKKKELGADGKVVPQAITAKRGTVLAL